MFVAGAYSLDDQRLANRAHVVARATLEGRQLLPVHPIAESPAQSSTIFRRLPYVRLLSHTCALLVVVVAIMFRALPTTIPDLSVASAGPNGGVSSSNTAEDLVLFTRAPGFVSEPGELALPEQSQVYESAEPAFTQYHTLQEGESLGEIARRYHIDVASIFWANDLHGDTIISAGQELRIPRLAGIPYIIQPDDTLASIAEHFQVPVEAITLFKANAVTNATSLSIGQELFVPGARQAYPEELLSRVGSEDGVAGMRAVITGSVYDDKTNLRAGPGRSYPRVAYLDAGIHLQPVARHEQWVKVDAGSEGSGWVRADMIALSEATFEGLPITNDFPPPPPRWIWPSSGSFTSNFGWRTAPFRSFHNGIDIANRAGTPVVAARAGRVVQAGWCSGYGYCVRINHGEGIETTYGHLLRKPPVEAGDEVEAGDLIGLMGSTYDRAGGGYSTGVHLHFTIKINGEAVNPMKYLP